MTRLRRAVLMFLVICLAGVPAIAQQNSAVKNLLLRFKNWRYGMVSVFKVSDEETGVPGLNILLGPKEPDLNSEAQECKSKDDIESYVLTGGEGMDDKEIQRLLREKGCKAYERYYTQRVAWERAQFKKAYVVTTRRVQGEPFQVIGLLTQRNSESYYGIKDDLDPPTDIFLATELQSKLLDEPVLVNAVVKKGREVLGGTAAASLLEFLENQVIQGNYENVTPEAQGIGEEGIRFARKRYGNTMGISEDDVQTYIRVSEGLPQDYQNNNEVIVSVADGVSYRRYQRKASAASAQGTGTDELDSTVAMNSSLPIYGVELRYGLEAINYPSVWSERLTLNALWGSSRLGLILPTNGWSSISTTFGNTRTMTYAGLGVSGAFDFPIKVVSESGVFNLSTSYVFDDAKQSNYMRYNPETQRNEDYLVRYHASLQYSFAVQIDKEFSFRMRLGGTLYGMESWAVDASIPDSVEYKKVATETIGGISGRIDFMTTAWSTPVGFSLSYFDESLLSLAWLQIPIMQNFAMRLDVQVFSPLLRDPHPWETNSVVIPSLRFIFNF
ncbi:MAG: hypothetical protein HYX66_04565 [Ignavibacteria bacterium]|nr:hypothetical protein [Ignavibacteria bacterium]